jgi:hypothetical protein
MISIKQLSRHTLSRMAVGLGAVAAAGTLTVSLGLTAASAAPTATALPASSGGSFTFPLVPSPGIHACLPHLGGSVTIIPGPENDIMRVSISGAPRDGEFDLFVIQQPLKPFGVSWYQTDVNADNHGNGQATVRGIFNVETFSVSPGGTTTFSPTHQYHLGLWFNDPNVPFQLGCEPGATAPIVTPFNGQQHAGIQALNTSEFPDNAGPLSHVNS